MALDFNNVRLLLWLRSNGIPLGDVLTIGRLGVFLSTDDLVTDAVRFGLEVNAPAWKEAAKSPYCEPILMAMGSSSVQSLDYSDYEGATLLHDLNQPVPDALQGTCDVLFDSGTLEHVFNVPQALENYVKLVRPGGWILLDMPSDGCCGHGFYQFSPELFFEFFTRATGCEMAAMFVVENRPTSDWFLVRSPSEIRRRVELRSSHPLHLFIAVRRSGSVADPASPTPVQADYDHAWNTSESPEDSATSDPDIGNCSRPTKVARELLQKFFPSAYWRFSTKRNARRSLRAMDLYRSPALERVDPFRWRMNLSTQA